MKSLIFQCNRHLYLKCFFFPRSITSTLYLKNILHFGSDTSDYITMPNSSLMNKSIQLSRDDLRKKILLLKDVTENIFLVKLPL